MTQTMLKTKPALHKCARDACHDVEVTSSRARYCVKCNCKRKAERERRLIQAESLFEVPVDHKIHDILKLPDETRFIIVNDQQIPFQDNRVMEAVGKFWSDYQPEVEVYNGDVFDFYNISDFNKNPTRRFHLQDELNAARAYLFERATANPGATTRVFIEGNHEDRLRRWLWKYGKEISSLEALELPTLLGTADMGMLHIPYRSALNLLGFHIEHGYKSSASNAYPVNVSRWMAMAVQGSGMVGHTHHMNDYSWTNKDGTNTFYENGCLCRMSLEYAPQPNWQHGFTYGRVFNNALHLVPVKIYEDGFMAEGTYYHCSKKTRR